MARAAQFVGEQVSWKHSVDHAGVTAEHDDLVGRHGADIAEVELHVEQTAGPSEQRACPPALHSSVLSLIQTPTPATRDPQPQGCSLAEPLMDEEHDGEEPQSNGWKLPKPSGEVDHAADHDCCRREYNEQREPNEDHGKAD